MFETMGILKRTKKTDAEATAPKASAQKKVAQNGGAAFTVLVRPLVSEKSTIAEGRGVYTFEVSRTATKIDVKNAVRTTYGVLPTTVRMINVEGKNVRFGSRLGRRQDWKKAIVTLPEGKTIDVHAGV